MSKKPVLELLKQLESELKNTKIKDSGKKHNIDTILKDLEDIVSKQDEAKAEGYSILIKYLENFEIAHPDITSLTTNLINTLSNIGI